MCKISEKIRHNQEPDRVAKSVSSLHWSLIKKIRTRGRSVDFGRVSLHNTAAGGGGEELA